MKLHLSKPDDPRGQHLILVAKPEEYSEIFPVIKEEVLKGRRLELSRNQRTGAVFMRFGMGYLERLLLAVPFAQLSEGVEKILFDQEMERLLEMPVPDFEVEGMKGELWEHQRVAASMLANEEIMLDNDDMGCISGDARIVINRGGGARSYTLAQLHRRFNRGAARGRNAGKAWRHSDIPTMTRSMMPDGTLRLNEIRKVIKKGVKPVVKVELASGRTVTCTPDHKFWTNNGWQEIQNVAIGSVVYTNGTEHNIEHDRFLNFHGFVPQEDTLVSVVPCGERMVYDLVMTDPARNFVVNGIIVHNSGKTKTILAAIVKKQWFPALVVVGNVSTKYAWKAQIEEWFPDLSYQIVDGTKAKRHQQIKSGADITICNVQALRINQETDVKTGETTIKSIANPALFEIDWEVLVCDEYHRLKNPSAQQTVGFLKMECGRFIGASGTPIQNKPEEAWTFLHKCDPERFPTYYGFGHQIGIYTPSGKLLGYKPSEMYKVKQWLNANSIRRRKEHIAAILKHHGHSADLPKVIYSSQTVSLTPEQRTIYDRIKKEMKLTLEDGSSKTIMQVLTQILRLKQACFSPELFGGSRASGKIDQIKEDVAMLVESGQKAIIFSEWSTATRILERELAQYNPAYVDGSVKGDMRNAEVDRFNNDPDCKLYIGTIGANQEAITLSAATYVLFADEAWNPMSNAQAEARSAAGGLRGMGVTVPVNIIRYHAEDTIEQRLSEKLEKKAKVFAAMIERDGGKQVRTSMIDTIKDLL